MTRECPFFRLALLVAWWTKVLAFQLPSPIESSSVSLYREIFIRNLPFFYRPSHPSTFQNHFNNSLLSTGRQPAAAENQLLQKTNYYSIGQKRTPQLHGNQGSFGTQYDIQMQHCKWCGGARSYCCLTFCGAILLPTIICHILLYCILAVFKIEIRILLVFNKY